MACCRLRVDVNHTKATLRQSIDKLKLGARNTLHRAKGFEVHLSYRRDDAHRGLHKVAYLLDVATLLGSHLDDKDLVMWFEVLAHGAHNTKRSVEVTRRHEHVVTLREHTIEEMLGRRLAKATRDTDNSQVRHGAQYALRVVIVPARDILLQGTIERIGNYGPIVEREQHRRHQRIARSKDCDNGNNRCREHHTCGNETLNTHGICQLNLVLYRELGNGDDQHPQTKDDSHGPMRGERKGYRREQGHKVGAREPLARRAQPTVVTLRAVGVLLKHLHRVAHHGPIVYEPHHAESYHYRLHSLLNI